MSYAEFIDGKLSRVPPTGLSDVSAIMLAPGLFDFQDAIVRWALRRGRAAIFADTGLGKSRMQLAWADTVHRETGHDVLILAPLAVAAQTADVYVTVRGLQARIAIARQQVETRRQLRARLRT